MYSVVYDLVLMGLLCIWCGVWLLLREVEPTLKKGDITVVRRSNYHYLILATSVVVNKIVRVKITLSRLTTNTKLISNI